MARSSSSANLGDPESVERAGIMGAGIMGAVIVGIIGLNGNLKEYRHAARDIVDE